MQKVKYIGGSHVRKLSAADLEGIGMTSGVPEDGLTFDTRTADGAVVELSNDNAKILVEKVVGEFANEGEEYEQSEQEALDVEGDSPSDPAPAEDDDSNLTPAQRRRKAKDAAEA